MMKILNTLGCLTFFACLPAMANAVEGIQAISKEVAKHQEQQEAELIDVYVDQLIDPEVAEDLPLDILEQQLEEETENEPEGIRAYQLNYRYKQNNDDEIIHGLDLSMYRQTAQYGDFRFTANISQFTPARISNDGENGIVFIQNTGLPVNDDTFADSYAGVISGAQNLLFNQFRYQSLSPQTFLGVHSRLYDEQSEFRVTHGTVGHVSDESYFTSEGIQVSGLAYAKQLKNDWQVASQAWLVEGGDAETEAAITLKKETSPWQSTQLQVVANEKGSGFAIETKKPIGRTRNHIGAYYLNDDLTWMGKGVTDDSLGFFLQSNYQTPRFSIYSSLDYQQTNLSKESDKKARWSFAQNYHVTHDRSSSYGGRLRLNVRDDLGIGKDWERDVQTGVYIQKEYASGFSHRVNADVAKKVAYVNQNNEDEQRLSLGYSANMLLADQVDLGVELDYENRQTKESSHNVLSTGVSLSKNFANGHYLSSNLYYRPSLDETEKSHWNGNISYDATLNKNWQLNAYANYGQTEDDEAGDYGVGMNLSYSQQTGRPYAIKGRGKGKQLGNIKGIVFLDENNDGKHQPSEKFAKNIRIRLDSVSTDLTNSVGEFEFSLVSIGSHQLSVDMDSIPLPWEISDSTRKVEVKLRETSRLMIPLSLIPGQDVNF
jgi:hypothetical protein